MKKADWKKQTKMSDTELKSLLKALSEFENTLQTHVGDIEKLLKKIEQTVPKDSK